MKNRQHPHKHTQRIHTAGRRHLILFPLTCVCTILCVCGALCFCRRTKKANKYNRKRENSSASETCTACMHISCLVPGNSSKFTIITNYLWWNARTEGKLHKISKIKQIQWKPRGENGNPMLLSVLPLMLCKINSSEWKSKQKNRLN